MMRVTTSKVFNKSAAEVWPLLTNSQMHLKHRSPLFRLGLPKPVQCRLPSGEGGVGKTRECISVDGIVHQEITEWDPPRKLSFRMLETNLLHRHLCSEVIEQFVLTHIDESKCLVTRTTNVCMRPGLPILASPAVGIGIKQVHYYVFANWTSTI